MFEHLKKIFNIPGIDNENPYDDVDESKRLQIATCTLFIELAKADDNFSDQERDIIISSMKSTFNLEDNYVNDLIDLSENRLKSDYSLYDFTKLINQNFSNDEKFELLKNLWRLIYVDKKLDMYEDHLIKKIGGLLNMGHEDIIGAKMLVKEEMGR